MRARTHQYIERSTGKIRDERLFGDAVVQTLYSSARESAPRLFKALTGSRMCGWLGYLHYDFPLGSRLTEGRGFLDACGIDWSECLDDPRRFKSLREVFERKIRYWQCRPMSEDPAVIVSPADARVLVGSLCDQSMLFLKNKFFDHEELLGMDGRGGWRRAFREGDFAVFRLTPDKYHYNHTPVAGKVVDFYGITGSCHSCNPAAVVELATPFSKNKRMVTVIDTDIAGGSEVGLVAMIEVVALMIGDIVQCYSDERYHGPVPVKPGLLVRKGQPKSLYRPGSSTDVLLFQKNRVRFCEDILRNMQAPQASSRFSQGFGRPLVETELCVRSPIAERIG